MKRLYDMAANVGRICIRVQPVPEPLKDSRIRKNRSVLAVDYSADDEEPMDSYMVLFTRPSEPDDPVPRESEPSLQKIEQTNAF